MNCPPMELSMDPGDLVWNDVEYKLKFILDNPNFKLPQIVRVHQGHMVDEDDALASGQILTIHGKKKIENVTGHDMFDREMNIPITCPYKLRIVSLGNPRRFSSVQDLCNSDSQPQYVAIENGVIDDEDVSLKADSILQIEDKVTSEEGDVVGLNCRVDDENENEGQAVTLPMHFVGGFIETLSHKQTNTKLSVSEIIKDYKLPIKVQFLSNSEKNSSYGPKLGVISLEKKATINSVLATTIIENVRHALTFSADLPVTVQVATGIKKNHYQYPSAVDLKRFDYCHPSDPYSGVTLQTFDDLHTPMLPRRAPQTPRQYRTKSVTDFNSRYSSTTSVSEPPKKSQSSSTIGKRNKSLDLGKNFENFFSSKLGLKNIRKSVSGKLSKDKSRKHSSENGDTTDLDETRSFITSDDGHSTADLCSIGITSNGSDSTCNDSFNRMVDCHDSISSDNSSIPHNRRRHSRKGSGDSGICLSGRKHPRSRSRSRSRSRMSPDAPSSNPSDTIDTFSEWSLPMNLKDSPSSGRKTYSSQGASSSSCLWGTDNSNIIDTQPEKTTTTTEAYKTDFVNNQNTINILNYHNTEKDSEIVTTKDIPLSPLTSKQLASMDEIRQLNEEGVTKILDILKFHDFKDIFIQNQINGELLLELELTDLVNDLKLSLFQAKKIVKYVKGWRPQSDKIQSTEASRRNSLNPRDWSENDVYLHMTTINLSEFGQFCIKNQVNGDLLLDILDKETLNSVKNDHNVKISNLESKKLLNFVVKGWRPDISPKKSAIL